MTQIRARLQSLLAQRGASRPEGERGFESAEWVIVVPLILVIVFSFIQGGLWYHSTDLVQNAAANAANAAGLYGASSNDGVSAGEATATQSGSTLSDVHVSVTRTQTEVTATVTARFPSLVPGMNNLVTKTVTGPVERWVP